MQDMSKTPKSAVALSQDAVDGATPTMTFEEALASLETIVARIESGSVGLEESVQQYEAGVKLVQHCQGVLAQAEQRIEELKLRTSP